MKLDAVIFDMDGLLIDSEPFWKEAEHQVFTKKGVRVSPELAILTAQMTTRQVTEFWYKEFPWSGSTLEDVENEVIDKVIALVTEKGQALAGVTETIKMLKANGIKIGLATNSPARVMHSILAKLKIDQDFDAISSSDEVIKGKPCPEIYQLTLSKLGVLAENVIAFEDSVGGLTASVAAGIKTIAVPENANYNSDKFEAAIAILPSLAHFQLTLASEYLVN